MVHMEVILGTNLNKIKSITHQLKIYNVGFNKQIMIIRGAVDNFS